MNSSVFDIKNDKDVYYKNSSHIDFLPLVEPTKILLCVCEYKYTNMFGKTRASPPK